MPFVVNEYVGPYLLIEQQGQGGMATVFKAYHRELDRYVAMKVMHTAFTEDPTFLERFKREALVVAKLDHPHIVPIFDSSNEDGRPYLVMKYIEGVTLKDKLKKFRPTYREMLPIIEDVGSALTYAHELGIVHRDVKPSNVLISKEGKVYLTDFGLARMAQASTTTLTSDQMIGTPQYISPEQATSSPNLDYRTDIYSFGVLIYEMVVGQVPYNADTPYAIIHDHIYTPLPLPSILNPNCPESIEKVLLKALAKDPADRYKDINTMVRAFRGAIRQLDGAQIAETPMPVEKPKKSAENQGYLSSLPVIENIEVPKTESAFPLKAKKKPLAAGGRLRFSKKWIWIGGSILAGILLIGLVAALLAGRKPQPAPAIASTAPPSVVIEPTLNLEPGDARAAESAWTKAMLYWQHNDPDSSRRMVNAIVLYANGDSSILGQAQQYFYAHDAWLPAAMLMTSLAQSSGNDLLSDPKAHQIVFMTSGDASAGDFIIQNAENPLFTVASPRYKLKFGGQSDQNSAGLKIEQLFGSKNIQTSFPEISLLKAEYLVKTGAKTDARKIIEPMMDDPNLPDWVRLFAKDQIYPSTRY